jgi:hypothetical protein
MKRLGNNTGKYIGKNNGLGITATMYGKPNKALGAIRIGAVALLALGLASCKTPLVSAIGEDEREEERAKVTSVLENPPLKQVAAVPTDKLEAPSWTVGDEWRYSDGYGFQVETVKDDLTRFRRLDDAAQWFETRGLFRERSQSSSTLREVVFRSESPDQLYTAAPGEAVVFVREYLSNGRLIRHRTSWVVEGRETITVPAGTFDCFVLVKRSRSLTGTWTGFERIWFSPAAKNYVRMEFKYGEAPDMARVLTFLDLKS